VNGGDSAQVRYTHPYGSHDDLAWAFMMAHLGYVETNCEEIGRVAHDNGSLLVVGIEPLSLGILTPPGEYGHSLSSKRSTRMQVLGRTTSASFLRACHSWVVTSY
jgi:Glycine cleavage system P-protein